MHDYSNHYFYCTAYRIYDKPPACDDEIEDIMNQKIQCTPKGTTYKYVLYAIIGIGVFIGSVTVLDLDVTKFLARLANVNEVLKRMMAFNMDILPEVAVQILVSICLAFSALLIGTILAFLLACLAAENIALYKGMGKAIKGIIAAIRAVPALVWVLMVVASIGFGNTGGMIGLIFPTVGYLTKSFASSFEEDGYDRIEALRSTGAGWINIIQYGILPQTAPKLISWIAMNFETNIASGISLGMVGVGGIGYLLNKAIQKFDYASITTIIVMIFLTMFLIEMAIQYMKRKLHTTS